jgi:hypothetical protein
LCALPEDLAPIEIGTNLCSNLCTLDGPTHRPDERLFSNLDGKFDLDRQA